MSDDAKTVLVTIQVPREVIERVRALLQGELFWASRHGVLQAALLTGFPLLERDPVVVTRTYHRPRVA